MAVTNEQVAELAKYFERLAEGYRDYLNEGSVIQWDTRFPLQVPLWDERGLYKVEMKLMELISELLQSVSEGDEAGIHNAKDTLNDYVPTIERDF